MIEYHRLEHEHEFAKNTLVVNWCLLNKCNYKCSYCPEFLHSGSSDWPKLFEVEAFCSSVIDLYEGKNIYFEFTGGEVTYWKDFKNLVQYLKSNDNVYVGVISNGSQRLSWWEEMREYFDQACLSFQPEYSKRDHYINLTKIINDYMRTHVNLMMHPDHFDLCVNVIEEIVRDVPNISVALQPLSVNFDDILYDYNKEQSKILDRQFDMYGSKVVWNKDWPVFRGSMKVIGEKSLVSSAHRFIAEGINKWRGWRCYAGVEQIVVDVNGYIWRGWCLEGGHLGHISEYAGHQTDPFICGKDYCHCNFDIMCTKEKI